MSAGAKIPWSQGLQVATDLILALAGTYRRVAVAGSIRRGKPEIGDVELVIAPLFDGAVNLLDQRCDQLLAQHVVEKRLNRLNRAIAWGNDKEPSRYKAMIYKGVAADVFVVHPDRQWGPTFLIRTGPGAANKALVTTEGTRTDEGDAGVLPKGLKFVDGALCRDGVPLDTPEEVDVYAACGLPWLPPPERTASEYLRRSRKRVTMPCYAAIDDAVPTATFPLYGQPPRDQIWRLDGWVLQLRPEIGEPTVAENSHAPVEQQNLFA